jgi:hypothetical protein
MISVQHFCHNEKAGSSPGFFVVCGATTCKLEGVRKFVYTKILTRSVYVPLILRFSSCHNTWFPSTTCCVRFLRIRLPKAHVESMKEPPKKQKINLGERIEG